jgi:UDP:flavonoid glycosyltransferase YjiC (YdhE family)
LRNGYLDNTVIDWVPGLPKAMRLRDFPSFIRTTDPDDVALAFTLRTMECHRTVPSAVVFHTFEGLETKVLSAMSGTLRPPVYAVGPLPPLLGEEEEDKLVGSNFSKEDRACLDWLDGKPPNSVVFVSFGSLVTPGKEQLAELACGLARSGYEFLWVVRNDQPEAAAALPEGRGRVTSWCPQEAVLRHAAVGAFLTHCGWNSMLESLCAGVPMLCWPLAVDQQTNSRLACTEWRVGVEIGEVAAREQVEAAVRRVMGEDEPRRSALEWKEKVARATAPGGSSWAGLDRVVNEVLTPLLHKH